MNRPTTRTEQMLASASKGVSSRSMLAEAARFVEPGEIFVAGLIQGSSGRLASPRAFRCSRVCVLTGVYQTSVAGGVFRTIWGCGRFVANWEVSPSRYSESQLDLCCSQAHPALLASLAYRKINNVFALHRSRTHARTQNLIAASISAAFEDRRYFFTRSGNNSQMPGSSDPSTHEQNPSSPRS